MSASFRQMQSRERARLELLRSKARAAAQALAETDTGAEALSDLRRMFTNRRGVSALDTVYKEQFMIVFEAFNAGLRDGIC